MNKIHQENLKRFTDELQYVDEVSQIVLKGQLLIEESLTRIIAKFVFNPDIIPNIRLSFYQKMDLARSMSLDEGNNKMWTLIASINELRNQLSHSLNKHKRSLKVEKLRQIYLEVCKGEEQTAEVIGGEEFKLVSFSLAQSIGFLGSFEAEIERFKSVVGSLDKIVNPHRHKPNGA